MAAGYLPRPGTPYGPCAGKCKHRDCAAIRESAAQQCPICGEPIGYDKRIYRKDEGHVHADCLEAAFEANP